MNVLVANVLSHTQSCKGKNVNHTEQKAPREIESGEEMDGSKKNLEHTNFTTKKARHFLAKIVVMNSTGRCHRTCFHMYCKCQYFDWGEQK